jgi:flagellar basal body P-ring protein FlgI
MKPNRESTDKACGRRRAFLAACLTTLTGCSALAVRSQSPEDEVEKIGSTVRTVGDLAVPFGMNSIAVEAVGLVSGLPGTGSDPPPSPQRAALLAEMNTRGVLNPNQVLASPTTEMVMVRGYLRPGIQKGDKFDIEIRVPSRSECSGLREGWLMETRLREMAVLGNQVYDGTLLALAEGPVLVDPSAKPDDRVANGRGRVLGGGISVTSREVGLVLKPEDRSVLSSSQIGVAVNKRFHTFVGGIKQGVAKPKTDEFIELKIHPRYRDNVERYMRVVRSIPLRESSTQLQARMTLLERQLLDPITSATAALRLEALGKDGIEVLKKGIASEEEEEVRFYAAEALAYLDASEAAAPLGQLARDVPAFRAYALAALSAMEDYAAFEALRNLLAEPSAETRYGAFRAIWAMNRREPLVQGEELGNQFTYHVLDVEGPAMVHVTRSRRPELVIFGKDQRLVTPLALEAGKKIMLTTLDQDHVTVSRFALNEPDQKRVVSTSLDEVIRAIVDLGGTYPDVVQALQQAKSTGALAARFEVDALPKGGRTYWRKGLDDEAESESETPSSPEIVVGTPLSDLFSRPAKEADEPKAKPADKPAKKSDSKAEKARSSTSLFGKITKRDD